MNGSGTSTGSTVGTIVGAVVGAVIGGGWNFGVGAVPGAMLGASIGGMVGGLAGAIYDSTNPQETYTEQESIADILFQTSTFGQPLVQIAGRNRIAGNVVDIGPKTEVEHRESVEPGKGGGTRAITVTKTYTVSLNIWLTDTRVLGLIAGISRAWADNTIIYDNSQSSAYPDGWTFYTGTSPALPDPTFEAIHGVGNEPGYPYTCRLIMANYDMGQNARVPNFNFELYQAGAGANPLTQVAVSPGDGNVWVAVPTLGQVWRYDENTRERTQVVELNADPPMAVAYGFNLFFDAAGYLWVSDPVAYAHYRLNATTGAIVATVNENISMMSNVVETGGYLWMALADYETENGSVFAWDAAGIASFAYTQDFKLERFWARACVTSYDGHIWTFSDRDEADTSVAIHINQTTGNQGGNVGIGAAGSELKDILATADGHLWVCNYTAGTIVRIDPATMTIVATITTGTQPVQAAIATDGYVWVASRGRTVTRINPATNGTQTFQSDMPNVVSPNNHIWAQAPAGAMWMIATDDWTAQRFTITGTTLTVRTGAGPRDCAQGAGNTVWVVCASGDLQQITDAGVITAAMNASALASVVGTLTEAAGLTASEYDVTGLPGAQVIMAITSIGAIRAPLEQLAQAFNFQMIESNRKLVYKLRGREAIVLDIPETDLDASSQSGSTPGLSINRTQEAELPTTLALNYISPTRNYQQNTQMAFVSNSRMPTENGRVINITIGLSDLEGKQRAQELLDRIWVERNTYSVRVGRKYAKLEPMDRIRVTGRGVQHTLTISEVNYGRPGILELQGRSDSASTQHVIGSLPGVVNPGGGVIPYSEHTYARLLNLPAMDENDTGIRYHVAYQGQDGGWPGATLHRSVDGGASYTLLHVGMLQGYIGTAVTALPDADAMFTDTINTVQVYMPYGSLASVTDAVFAGGGGTLAMLGNELIYAKNAVLVAADTYELSYLLRGRRGTEHQTDTHAIAELFVHIDASVYKIPMTLPERYVERPFKAVTQGLLISTVTAQNFTPTGSNLVLWALFPETMLSGTDWVFSWWGRSRWNGAWVDSVGASPDEDFLYYRLEIYSDGTYATVVRTVDQSQGADFQAEQVYTYSSANQVSDLGSAGGTIYYRLFQVGAYGLGDRENLVAA